MNTQPKPTWITLVSLCAICIAAFFFIVPLLRSEPVVQSVFVLLIAVALFDVVALWSMANKDALEREFSRQNQKDKPYRYYAPIRQPAKKQASKKPEHRIR